MPGGETTTTALSDSLQLVVGGARQVREFPTGFMESVDKKPLEQGSGVAYREVVFSRINAQSLGQLTRMDNPQELADTLFSIEPEIIGVHVVLTRKVQDQIARNAFEEIGGLMQNAIQRRKHTDGIAVYDTATFSQPGAGNTLSHGVISAIVAQIRGNATEHAPIGEKIHAWLNPYQIHDLQAELGAPVGTYTIQPGLSAEAYEKGSQAVVMVGGAEVHYDGLVRVDSADDAHGGVHAFKGILLVEWDFPDSYEDVLKNMAGAKAMWLYDGYSYGERSSGTQFGRVISDAIAPTA